MPYYLPAYDTEPIFPWWDLGDRPYSAHLYQQSVSYEGRDLQTCLDGIRAVADVHQRLKLPATFFVVAKLAVAAPSELKSILDQPLFDIQCHSYSHEDLVAIENNNRALEVEIVEAKKIIEDTFGRQVRGFTTPGGFVDGMRGKKKLLEYFRKAGYSYIRSVGLGPSNTIPAPLTQPFFYAEDGYPDLLEIALHAWHDNVLTGQPFLTQWPPALPWGFPKSVPATPAEAFEAYWPGVDYVVANNLKIYVPCFHPWSIYRFDSGADHIRLLLQYASAKLEVVTCTDYSNIARTQGNFDDAANVERWIGEQ